MRFSFLVGGSSTRGALVAAPPALAAPHGRLHLPWCAFVCAAIALVGASIVVRGCGYSIGLPVAYAGYFGLHIVLPGVMALYLLRGDAISVARIFALGLPTGFAVEIGTYLGLSAIHALSLMRWVPILWAGFGLVAFLRGHAPRWERPVGRPTLATVGLCFVGLATVVIAAGHLYAESPLVDGLPQRPIFHDWMYLLSQATAIKRAWPIEDPSLAGTALQYHYFLLVHVASASAQTGIDVTWILLRLAPIPLGLVLVAQAYLLGRRCGGSAWAGVLAAFLLIFPGEVSSANGYGNVTYLGFFLRWLYVSPTFLFGLVFFGALTLAWLEEISPSRRGLAWFALIAAAATAAKGPVVPVVLVAVAAHALFIWWADRQFPWRRALAALVMTAAFSLTYWWTLSAWGSGDAAVQPFRLCEITPFWQDHAVVWQRALKRGLHAPTLGTWLGKSATAACILAGTAGVRLLALPYLAGVRDPGARRRAAWLSLLVVSGVVFGFALHFDGDGELYFLFLARLPLAVLGATACAAAVPWLNKHWQKCGPTLPRRLTRGAIVFAIATVCTICGFQVATTVRCEAAGVRDWVNFRVGTPINEDLHPLFETTRWLRAHTEPNAVLVSNAFTADTLGRDRGILVDHITVGVNYHLSALSGRRLWVEGPAYTVDTAEARERLVVAARYFRGGRVLPAAGLHAPIYVVMDHTVPGASRSTDSRLERVFANARFEVFRARPLAIVRNTGAMSPD